MAPSIVSTPLFLAAVLLLLAQSTVIEWKFYGYFINGCGWV
ncbi:hypothetical protein ACHAWC_001212 [Mediolabrus comicus]